MTLGALINTARSLECVEISIRHHNFRIARGDKDDKRAWEELLETIRRLHYEKVSKEIICELVLFKGKEPEEEKIQVKTVGKNREAFKNDSCIYRELAL